MPSTPSFPTPATSGQKVRLRPVGHLRGGHRFVQLRFNLLAHRVVGADQQVADDGAKVVAQRRDRDDGRKPAAVLADVGQLVDVLDSARRLEGQRLEARRDGRAQFLAQRQRARQHFLRVVDVARIDPVHDFGGLIAQHPLGADVEQLNDALLVGRDDREIRAGENGVLQRPGLEQRGLAPRFAQAIGFRRRRAGCRAGSCKGHRHFPRKAYADPNARNTASDRRRMAAAFMVVTRRRAAEGGLRILAAGRVARLCAGTHRGAATSAARA
jgi:hypothetical protein